VKEKRIEITEGITGRKVGATLLLCPECEAAEFLVYFPDGINHSHFQCVTCDTTFCDGCHVGLADVAEPDEPAGEGGGA
jgi:hypothetical protein